MTAGELLREVRRRHAVTQAQLAARAGTTQSAISRIESGRLSPTVETLGELLFRMGEELALDAAPIDYGHDRTLLRANLRQTPEDRLRATARLARSVRELQRAGH